MHTSSSPNSNPVMTLLGIALIALSLVSGLRSHRAVSYSPAATAGLSQNALSPSAQHTLYGILAGVSPDVRQLVLHAVIALGPRAEMELQEVEATDPALRAAGGQLAIVVLQHLRSPQDRQRFVNGLFEVSASDVAFRQQVERDIQTRIGLQDERNTMLSTFGGNMRQLAQQNRDASEANIDAMAQSGTQALGPNTLYEDAYGHQAQGTPGIGTPYLCPGNFGQWVVVPGPNGPPALSCTPARS